MDWGFENQETVFFKIFGFIHNLVSVSDKVKKDRI